MFLRKNIFKNFDGGGENRKEPYFGLILMFTRNFVNLSFFIRLFSSTIVSIIDFSELKN